MAHLQATLLTLHSPLSSLSDFSDYDYDSSDQEYRASHSRRASLGPPSRRESLAATSKGHAAVQQPLYRSLEDQEADAPSQTAGLLDPNDPFADPDDFLGSIGGSSTGKAQERMECELHSRRSS
jgi:hypothetical protein